MKIETELKAQTLATAMGMITGFKPSVSERPDGTALLMFSETDLPKIRKGLETLALRTGKGKGDVAVNFAPVITPLALKYALPVIVGVLVAGGIVGYLAAQK